MNIGLGWEEKRVREIRGDGWVRVASSNDGGVLWTCLVGIM